jgi:hypothetical protein
MFFFSMSHAVLLSDSLAIPAPPRARHAAAAAPQPRLPAWREAMLGAIAGLVLSLLAGEVALWMLGL